jgi:hypothetical protein
MSEETELAEVCSLVATEAAVGMEPILQTSLGIGLGCSMEDCEDFRGGRSNEIH